MSMRVVFSMLVWVCGTVEQWKQGPEVWWLTWLMICSFPNDYESCLLNASLNLWSCELWSCGIGSRVIHDTWAWKWVWLLHNLWGWQRGKLLKTFWYFFNVLIGQRGDNFELLDSHHHSHWGREDKYKLPTIHEKVKFCGCLTWRTSLVI